MGNSTDRLMELSSVDVKPHVRLLDGKLVKVKGYKRRFEPTPLGIKGVPRFRDMLDAEEWLTENVGDETDLSINGDADDLRVVQEVCDQIHVIQTKYPKIREPLPGVRNGRPFNGVRTFDSPDVPVEVEAVKGSAWGASGGNTADERSTSYLIWVQPGGYAFQHGPRITSEQIGRTVDGRRFPAIVPTTPAEAMTHELGHVYAANIGINDDLSGFQDIVGDVWESFEDMAVDVSQYATASPQECFAEVFTLLNHSHLLQKKSKISQLRIAKFRRLLNERWKDAL